MTAVDRDAAAHVDPARPRRPAHKVHLTEQSRQKPLDGPRPIPGASPVFIVSGIAHPERFRTEAVAAGYDVRGALAFADHHPYGAADITRISARALDARAAFVLTTEKDLVRLLPLRPWPFRLAVRRMSVRVEPEQVFAAWLRARLSRDTSSLAANASPEGAA